MTVLAFIIGMAFGIVIGAGVCVAVQQDFERGQDWENVRKD